LTETAYPGAAFYSHQDRKVDRSTLAYVSLSFTYKTEEKSEAMDIVKKNFYMLRASMKDRVG